MFNGDVDVKIIAEEQEREKSVTNIGIDNAVLEKKEVSTPSQRLFIYAMIASGILATVFFFMPAGLLFKENIQFQKKDIPTFFLFSYDNCPVYTIQNNSISLSERKKSLFMELVTEGDIVCLNGASFLYQVSESYLYGREGRAFISRCTIKDNEYISCLNYYWSGNESKL